MKNVLLDKGIILPSGEISKDNISPEEKSFFNKIKNLFK